MADYYYPPTSFHFLVYFDIPDEMQAKFTEHNIVFQARDVEFQSVSGLDVQLQTETLKEGGENRFEHVLPTRTKYSNLSLKRGVLAPNDTGLTDWCKKTFEQAVYLPLDILVFLLDQDHSVLMYWSVVHAYPVNWKMGELNAEKGEILIETLELNYNYFTFH